MHREADLSCPSYLSCFRAFFYLFAFIFVFALTLRLMTVNVAKTVLRCGHV